MEDAPYHVGILFVSLHIPQAQSLKEKRMVLRSLKDRISSRYDISVAELDGQDKWQTATLGFALLNSDKRYIEGYLQDILSRVEGSRGVLVCDHKIEFY